LKTNTIIDRSNSTYNFKQSIQIEQKNQSNNIIYSLELKESDKTKSKALQIDYNNGFSLMLQNIWYEDFISIIYNELGNFDSFIFKGNLPKNLSLDILVTSKNKESKLLILNDLVANLSKRLNYKLDKIEKDNTKINRVTFF